MDGWMGDGWVGGDGWINGWVMDGWVAMGGDG